MRFIQTFAGLLLSSAALGASTLAWAEEAPAASGGSVGELVVTAQRREEKLRDVPQAVSVITSQDIERLGAVQFRDFAATVPGLTFTTTGAGFSQITLRGVTAGIDLAPTVAVYVDDVPYGSSSSYIFGSRLALDVGLFDVSRIEVLKGPQGTLYGASSMGGVLKYVSTAPSPSQFGIDVRSGVSSTEHGSMSYDAAATVNAPINDKVAVRATGFESHDGGYVDNVTLGQKDVNKSDIYGGRLDVLLTPTDRLNIRLSGFAQDIRRDGEAQADFLNNGLPLVGSLDQKRNVEEFFRQQFSLGSATINYDLGPATLTSVTSYQTMRVHFLADNPTAVTTIANRFGVALKSVGTLNDVRNDKFTQEVRLASAAKGPLEWVAGAYYTTEDGTAIQDYVLTGPAGQTVPNTYFHFEGPVDLSELAGFANLTWHITDRFDISGGLRHSHLKQTIEQIGAGPLAGASRAPNTATNDVNTWLADARYHFNDQVMVYARYATGYRPGGPNFVILDPTGKSVGPNSFSADNLKSYEVGLKAETPNHLLGADLSAYHLDWNDIVVVAVLGGVAYRTNAPGGAAVDGFEAALTSHPTPQLSLAASLAYEQAQLKADEPALAAKKGTTLPNVPRYTAGFSADYVLVENDLRPTIGAAIRYEGDRHARFGSPYILPHFTTVDLRAGFTTRNIDWQLYIHNLTDKRGELSSYLTTATGPKIGIEQPRTIGVSARAHF